MSDKYLRFFLMEQIGRDNFDNPGTPRNAQFFIDRFEVRLYRIFDDEEFVRDLSIGVSLPGE